MDEMEKEARDLQRAIYEDRNARSLKFNEFQVLNEIEN